MNKTLSPQEVEHLSSAALTKRPGADVKPEPMTRREKLNRWARIVRETPTQFFIWNGLEHAHPRMLDQLEHRESAFAAAANDPVLKAQGIAGPTVGDSIRFFELSREDVHLFSCDCHGAISNASMADRIERIADGSPGLFAEYAQQQMAVAEATIAMYAQPLTLMDRALRVLRG